MTDRWQVVGTALVDTSDGSRAEGEGFARFIAAALSSLQRQVDELRSLVVPEPVERVAEVIPLLEVVSEEHEPTPIDHWRALSLETRSELIRALSAEFSAPGMREALALLRWLDEDEQPNGKNGEAA